MKKTFIIISILFITISLFAKAPDNDDLGSSPSSISTIDLQTFINANKLLMFVTNRGSIGYDQAGVFGRNEGLYYPFIGFENPFSVTIKRSVVFAGGIWIAGVDNATGDTLVTVAEYSDDYWPGPMVGGTYHADGATNPSYRVYKIYKDSMSDNPNDDYLNWPVSDGAPVDNYGAPLLIGEQTLWSVFNDANPGQKLNSAGSVANPVGIEIQQTTWAVQEPGDIEIPLESVIDVQQLGNSKANVEVYVSDYLLLTGDDYVVVVDSHLILGSVWHLDNITENIRVLENQTDSTTIDGFLVIVEFNINETIFSSFQVVANGNGVLDPPVPGALGSQGFPTPGDGDPDNSQQVGEGKWALHTGDNGGSCNFGNRGSYDKFLERSMRGDNVTRAGFFDYEMRFTGDTNSSGEYDKSLGGGSVAIRFFQDDLATWVPFELWRTGINTPNDQSDDVRLIVWHLDIADDSIYNLEGYGCSAGPAGGEHSASPDDDDPLTDWIYWYLPVQDSLPGESGYNKAVAEILAGTYSSGDNEIIARTVLINVNSSIAPPFNQSLPEPGTIFRIENSASAFGPFPIDTFTFTANEVAPPLLAGADDLSIYTRYKLINKGGKNLKDFYICLWFDPDLGDAGDDLIGCDTVNNIFFCYNDGPDRDYGYKVPVFGGKVLEGPIVPSPGDVATVNGKQIPNYKLQITNNFEIRSFRIWDL